MMPKEERGIALRDNVVSSSSSPDWKTRLNMASFFSFFSFSCKRSVVPNEDFHDSPLSV